MNITYSMDYRLWKTIRALFYRKGQPFLDNLLYIEDPTEFDDYKKRYKDFNVEFEKHFNLDAFYGSQVGSEYPLVTLGFRETNNTKCSPEYLLIMNYTFQTISPTDCRDDEVSIANSPDGILGYKSILEQSFIYVLGLIDCLDSVEEDWKVYYRIGKTTSAPLNQTREIQFGSNSYQLYIRTKC